MNDESHRHIVLIVDDVIENLDVLGRILSEEYRVKVARNGQEALAVANSEWMPDLILLDVMMPGIDGYEVCKRLKEDRRTKDIPVVFLTALSDAANEAFGLELGAVDYITKPFVTELVRRRVRNHLALRVATRELQLSNEHLEELVRKRTRDLAVAHRRLKILDEAKHDFLCAISHELRTPACGIIGIAELALEGMSDDALRKELRVAFDRGCKRLRDTLENALRIARLQAGNASLQLDRVPLEPIIRLAWEQCRERADKETISLACDPIEGKEVMGDGQLLLQAFTTLLQMMVRFARTGEEVKITVGGGEDRCDLLFVTHGAGLPPDAVATFFDTFSHARISSLVQELGLAVPVAGKLILAMGGEVRIEPGDPDGVRLSCSLPTPRRETTPQEEVSTNQA